MTKLIIMCGPPGAGKTTYASKFDEYEYVSRDDIRFNMLEDGDEYFKYELQVWNDFVSNIVQCLENEEDVIADATHLNKASRNKLIKTLQQRINFKEQAIEIECWCIEQSLSECVQHNCNREGNKAVPISILRRMYEGYTRPSFEENEFIAKIVIIHNGKIIEEYERENG